MKCRLTVPLPQSAWSVQCAFFVTVPGGFWVWGTHQSAMRPQDLVRTETTEERFSPP